MPSTPLNTQLPNPVLVDNWPRVNACLEADVCEAIEAITRAHLDTGGFDIALLIPDDDVIRCAIIGMSTQDSDDPDISSLAQGKFLPYIVCAPALTVQGQEVVTLLWISAEGDIRSRWTFLIIRDGRGHFEALGEWIESEEEIESKEEGDNGDPLS